MKNELKINSSSSVSELEQTVEIVVLSVKPNIMPVIFSELEGIDSKLYISIAAGITLEALAKGIGADKKDYQDYAQHSRPCGLRHDGYNP